MDRLNESLISRMETMQLWYDDCDEEKWLTLGNESLEASELRE